jgi:hypothetical protein
VAPKEDAHEVIGVATQGVLVAYESAALSSYVTPVNFDFTTAAVVSFVLVILGLAATLLLMIRLANRHTLKGGD